VWVVDLAREALPRRLTHGTDVRAFFTSPDEFVYTSDDNRLHRMKIDGSGGAIVSGEPVAYLSAVSPDGRWASRDAGRDGAQRSCRDSRSHCRFVHRVAIVHPQ
jgi:hypothetical protein